jgi:hypothetical protein
VPAARPAVAAARLRLGIELREEVHLLREQLVLDAVPEPYAVLRRVHEDGAAARRIVEAGGVPLLLQTVHHAAGGALVQVQLGGQLVEGQRTSRCASASSACDCVTEMSWQQMRSRSRNP